MCEVGNVRNLNAENPISKILVYVKKNTYPINHTINWVIKLTVINFCVGITIMDQQGRP
jgi:hypothetical protein